MFRVNHHHRRRSHHLRAREGRGGRRIRSGIGELLQSLDFGVISRKDWSSVGGFLVMLHPLGVIRGGNGFLAIGGLHRGRDLGMAKPPPQGEPKGEGQDRDAGQDDGL